jgi:DNA helicase-2/ATP-dependent DNA helicase PcrA
MAGDAFKNVFVVADDDQIIYQWAGASFQQILAFRQHFSPTPMQLVENRRCPPEIVQAANNLIAHNVDRTPGKAPLVSTLPSAGPAIVHRAFATETEEAESIAAEIARQDTSLRNQTAVLGRTRAVLQPVLDALRKAGVTASIATRRDRFVSPQFIWLQSALELTLRPTDRQMFTAMAGAANRIAGIELDAAILAAEAESADMGYLEYWALAAPTAENEIASRLSDLALRLVQSRVSWRKIVAEALAWLPDTAPSGGGVVTDAEEDKAAWEMAAKAIRAEKGSQPELDELLQGIALRPKEPPPEPNAVRLLTIHAAKGLEFDHVWVVGLAESVLPSWQSLKPQARPAELEEERRNFFVAITRTRKRLFLTHASQYRGWKREPSRFIAEMNIVPLSGQSD